MHKLICIVLVNETRVLISIKLGFLFQLLIFIAAIQSWCKLVVVLRYSDAYDVDVIIVLRSIAIRWTIKPLCIASLFPFMHKPIYIILAIESHVSNM